MNLKRLTSKLKRLLADTGKVSKSMGDVTGKARLMKAALTGLAVGGVGIFAKSLIGAAAEMETLETKFQVLLGDVDSAKARMQELSKFASSTPFQLTEIANASRVLQTLGGTTLATGESLRLVGDAAAISGESFENLAVHVGRAYSGLQANRPIGESLARLQELGLVSGETRNQIEDLTKAAKGEDAWKVLQKELQKSSGGMETLSKTFGGLASTLKDQFSEALRQISNSGFFDDIKDGLAAVVGKMAEWIDSGVFQRIGAGWDYMKFGFIGMSQVVTLGFQRIGEASVKMLKEMVGAVNGFLNFLPDSIIPDSWTEGMSHATKTLDLLYKDVQDGADDMQANALDNLSKMQTAWGKMTGSVKLGTKTYVEANKAASKSDTDRADNNAKANDKQLSDDAAFYAKLSQDMANTQQEEL
jgi:phage-related protein